MKKVKLMFSFIDNLTKDYYGSRMLNQNNEDSNISQLILSPYPTHMEIILTLNKDKKQRILSLWLENSIGGKKQR